MDSKNSFDSKMELNRKNIPKDMFNALIYVVDTLDLCIAAAETLFGEAATPDHALAIYDRAMQAEKLPRTSRSRP